uniref:Organic cation transporter protein-like n=2 Tax=Hirondellea gigas TaxID=1518452 RepID=A0A2P2I3M6_9CRUS
MVQTKFSNPNAKVSGIAGTSPNTLESDGYIQPLIHTASTPLFLDDVINGLGVGWWTFLFFATAAVAPMALVGNLFVSEFIAPAQNFSCVSQRNPSINYQRNNKYNNQRKERIVIPNLSNLRLPRSIKDKVGVGDLGGDKVRVGNPKSEKDFRIQNKNQVEVNDDNDAGNLPDDNINDFNDFIKLDDDLIAEFDEFDDDDWDEGGNLVEMENWNKEPVRITHDSVENGKPDIDKNQRYSSENSKIKIPNGDIIPQNGGFDNQNGKFGLLNVDTEEDSTESQIEPPGGLRLLGFTDTSGNVVDYEDSDEYRNIERYLLELRRGDHAWQRWDENPPGDRILGAGWSECKEECSEYVFDTSTYSSTITQEFGLICEKDWLRPLFQLLFTLGCLVGALAGGLLAARYGRQTTVWYGSLVMVVCTAVMLLVPVLEVVFACRFFLGVSAYVAVNPLTTLALEICPSNFRHVFGPIESLPYALMLPLLALIAFCSTNWRSLQYLISLPLLATLLLANPLVLDESPRWLMSKGRLKEAEKVIRRAARMNKTTHSLPVHLPEVLERIHKTQLCSGESDLSLRQHLWSLVSTSEMRLITIVTMLMWMMEGALYICLPMQAGSYESPYLYLAVLGLLEIPGSFLVAPMGRILGRRIACFILSLITAAGMMAMAFLHFIDSPNEMLIGAFSVAAYASLVGVSQMVIILTSELFPTTVRSLGNSLGYCANNLGICIPPLLDMMLPKERSHISLLLYSGMGLATGFLGLLLPETNNRRLFETVEEHVQDQRQQRFSSKAF